MAAKNFYRVKDGVFHGANNQFGPGSIVELTEAEAAGLLDKLVLVEGGESPQEGERQQQGSTPFVKDDRLVVSVPAGDAKIISKPDVKKAVKDAEAGGKSEV